MQSNLKLVLTRMEHTKRCYTPRKSKHSTNLWKNILIMEEATQRHELQTLSTRVLSGAQGFLLNMWNVLKKLALSQLHEEAAIVKYTQLSKKKTFLRKFGSGFELTKQPSEASRVINLYRLSTPHFKPQSHRDALQTGSETNSNSILTLTRKAFSTMAMSVVMFGFTCTLLFLAFLSICR